MNDCTLNVTSGIKNVVINCGCTFYDACLGVEVKTTEKKEKIKVCGAVLEPVFIIGYEISLESMTPLPLFEDKEDCLLKGNLSIEAGSKNGTATYANYEGAIFSYLGTSPSDGVWIYRYQVSAKSMKISQDLPPFNVEIAYENCLYRLVTQCEIEAATFAVIVDGVTELSLYTNAQGELVGGGALYGPLDGFTLPYEDFTLKGFLTSGGRSVGFEVEATGQCPPMIFSCDGPSYIGFQGYAGSTYTVEYSDYVTNTFTSTSYVGSSNAQFPNRGSINVTGCGITDLFIGGQMVSANLGAACVTVININSSTITDLQGGQVTDYTGNGLAVPPCNWPIISYTDHQASGDLDLTCYGEIEEVDLSNSTITSLLASQTLIRLDVSGNSNVNDGFNFCQFANLELFAANDCDITNIDLTCAPDLKELYINNNPLNQIITNATHGLKTLEMSGTPNTSPQFTFLGTMFPSLEVLHWSYTGLSDIIRLGDFPLLNEFYCDNSDPNPFLWSFNITDMDTIRKFTYTNGPVTSNDLMLITARLVSGGLNNCFVYIATGNVPPNSNSCGHIATLQSRGCTVFWASGGAC